MILIVFTHSGKDRNMNIVELFCATCLRWFHESCISYQLGKLVPFMMNYVFFCKNCSPTGLESFKKNQARRFPFVLQSTITNYMPTLFFIQNLHKCVLLQLRISCRTVSRKELLVNTFQETEKSFHTLILIGNISLLCPEESLNHGILQSRKHW